MTLDINTFSADLGPHRRFTALPFTIQYEGGLVEARPETHLETLTRAEIRLGTRPEIRPDPETRPVRLMSLVKTQIFIWYLAP